MRNHKRLIIGLFLAMFASAALTGCNTMAGLGEDIEEAGDQIEECAEGVDC